MTNFIHPTAIVDNKASIGENVSIGPYSTIGRNVVIENNSTIHSHVIIDGNTKIGEGNEFYPFAAIGLQPQHLKYSGELTDLTIGNNNIFRENVTISKGTKDGGMLTHINNKNLFMTGVHIAHDCKCPPWHTSRNKENNNW